MCADINLAFPTVNSDVKETLTSIRHELFNEDSLFGSLEEEARQLREKYTVIENLEKELEGLASLDPRGCIIKLSIGGTKVDVKRDSLEKCPRNYLSLLLSGRYDRILPRDREGRIFIDIDIEHIEPILGYIQRLFTDSHELLNDSPDGLTLSPLLLNGVPTVLQYFNLPIPYEQIIDSAILSWEADRKWVRDALGCEYEYNLKLIHRASRDGFLKTSFDGRLYEGRQLLLLIKDTNENVIGTFSDLKIGYYQHSQQFSYYFTGATFFSRSQIHFPSGGNKCDWNVSILDECAGDLVYSRMAMGKYICTCLPVAYIRGYHEYSRCFKMCCHLID
jgi:hypothetical protein